jgi:hypothetical protein
MSKYKSKFDKVFFKTIAEFEDWMSKMTFKKIHLEDRGQDMQLIFVHKSGEILNTDFNVSLYLGKFVDLENLDQGKCLRVYDKDLKEFDNYSGLVISKIEIINEN